MPTAKTVANACRKLGAKVSKVTEGGYEDDGVVQFKGTENHLQVGTNYIIPVVLRRGLFAFFPAVSGSDVQSALKLLKVVK